MEKIIKAVCGAETVEDSLFDFLYNNCSEQRRIRASKFYRKEDAYRSLIAESLLMYCLNHEGIAGEMNICIDSETGKPFLENSSLHFNITHSGDWVGCVIDDSETGIDIEKIREMDKGIANRFFSDSEKKMLFGCNNKEKFNDLFFEMWVLKESYIKAIGKGLSCPLNSFSVLPYDNQKIDLVLHKETLPHKYFRLYDISSTYKCAICSSDEKSPDSVDIISVEDLVELIQNKENN
ncbi:MAG TPA: 4'-phosphopantetheinyl transferase superfamily protein [Chitinispirillaceae bacterium]|nr:4'-phosphopantetheinyl transferase superfamily protein [Chitinispirillaceae bacterium]